MRLIFLILMIVITPAIMAAEHKDVQSVRPMPDPAMTAKIQQLVCVLLREAKASALKVDNTLQKIGKEFRDLNHLNGISTKDQVRERQFAVKQLEDALTQVEQEAHADLEKLSQLMTSYAENEGVYQEQVTTLLQMVTMSNPCIDQYIAAQKNLITSYYNILSFLLKHPFECTSTSICFSSPSEQEAFNQLLAKWHACESKKEEAVKCLLLHKQLIQTRFALMEGMIAM